MTLYLLDTNIVSDAIKPVPSDKLGDWLSQQPDGDLYVSSATLAEILRGILIVPIGRRRKALEEWYHGPDGPPLKFHGRILVFDERAAAAWAKLMADGKTSGRPLSNWDTMIGAIAVVNNCVVVTANDKDFIGVEVLNPLRA